LYGKREYFVDCLWIVRVTVSVLDLGGNVGVLNFDSCGIPCTIGAGSDEFTVEVHHGGFFVGSGQLRSYIDGKVSWYDFCDADTWSPLWFDDFVEELGYDKTERPRFY